MNKISNLKIIFFVIFSMHLFSCTHSLHLSHVSDFSPTYLPYNKGVLIKSEAEQFVILGVVQDTQFVEQAVMQLQNQCSNGQIQGITTQYSTSHGFFSWTNRLQLQGLCVKN